MKTVLKRIGFCLLIVAMMYASNWDLPKQEEIKVEMPEQIVHRIVTKEGDILESPYFTSDFIRENHVEPYEIYVPQEALLEDYLIEKENNDDK